MACKRSSVRLRYSPLLPDLQSGFFMRFYTYIIYSPSLDQYYVGHSEDLNDRIFRHNNSGSKATKKVNDWQLVYKEEFSSRSLAVVREMNIKKKKSRKYIEKLINSVE